MNARLLTNLRSKLRVRALLRQKILGHSTQQVFARMYERNSWANGESASGNGSDLKQTALVRKELSRLIADFDIRTLLDAPCGDFYWMKEVDRRGSRYLGVDIVPKLIAANERNYGNATTSFSVLDIVKDELPRVDLIVCRDCLVHLPLEAGVKTLQAFFRSGSKYLLSTTYPGLVKKNRPLYITGNWRPLDLERPPFLLPAPLRVINEGCTEAEDYAEKSLGLWILSGL
ncbi:MAG: methyltransferase domain-containing protein [Pseudomonadota bacterium]|nr:methyltransferase domain-containing protein [Pseudomonadota bacterium]